MGSRSVVALVVQLLFVSGCRSGGAVVDAPPPVTRVEGSLPTTELPLCPDTTAVGPEEFFFEFQVDRPVSPLVMAVPTYPAELRERGVEGEVLLQFVVNTAGCAASGSWKLLKAADSLFVSAAREAVRRSRYRPAEHQGRIVAQVIQQPFKFRLDPPATESRPPTSQQD